LGWVGRSQVPPPRATKMFGGALGWPGLAQGWLPPPLDPIKRLSNPLNNWRMMEGFLGKRLLADPPPPPLLPRLRPLPNFNTGERDWRNHGSEQVPASGKPAPSGNRKSHETGLNRRKAQTEPTPNPFRRGGNLGRRLVLPQPKTCVLAPGQMLLKNAYPVPKKSRPPTPGGCSGSGFFSRPEGVRPELIQGESGV